MGQTYDPTHLTCMPVMMKTLISSNADDMPQTQPPDSTAAQVCDTDEPVPMEIDQPEPAGTTAVPYQLYTYETCHIRFFTKHGFDQHDAVVSTDTKSSAAPPSTTPKTIKDMLVLPSIEHPAAAKTYTCPICHAQVGRKALCAHIRKEHQVDRPCAFSFEPEYDQLPGELACKHCYSVFTMDFALQTHFRRASCPVLFYRWLSNQYFGMQDTTIEPYHQVPPTTPALGSNPIDTTCGLMPLEASSRIIDCQLNVLLWTPDLLFFRNLCHTPSFVPELHIRWLVTSVRWSAHCELPHTCFTADQVFLFLADLEHFVPVHWAWTSSELRFPDVTEYVAHESVWSQHAILIDILHNLVSARLSADWTLWNDLAALTHDRRLGDDSRRSIVCGPVGRLWRAIPKAAPDQIPPALGILGRQALDAP